MTVVTDEPLCDVKTVGKLLAVSNRTVWRLVDEGRLHPIRSSRSPNFDAAKTTNP
jgi:hypothetical protein